MYILARGLTEDSDKVLALLQCIGTSTLEKIIDWTSPDKPQAKSYQQLIDLLKEKFSCKKNLTALRFQFFTEKQHPGQTLQEYLAYMTQLYGQCSMASMKPAEYGVLAILQGLASDELRQYLMNPGNKIDDMSKVQDLALNFEQSRNAAKAFKGVDGQIKPYAMNVIGKGMKCRYCGDGHQRGKENCPAKDKTCSKCGKKDHFAKVCRSESTKQQNFVERYPNESERAESLNGIYGVLTVSSRFENSHPPFTVAAKLNGVTVAMQHDSGAAVSIIGKKVWHTIGKPRIYPSSIQLRSYNKLIPVIGQCKVIVQHERQIKQQWVIVVPQGESLFGRNWIQDFNVRLQRHCNTSKDQKGDECIVYKQHTVATGYPSFDRQAAKDIDKSSCLQNTIINAKQMHDTMQGKENKAPGKHYRCFNAFKKPKVTVACERHSQKQRHGTTQIHRREVNVITECDASQEIHGREAEDCEEDLLTIWGS
uniref:CCHC-type domain-containing protein n=1 Tax=Panagrolaimus superbus TaxID=310955 RepID=A0A914YQL5_9BILA